MRRKRCLPWLALAVLAAAAARLPAGDRAEVNVIVDNGVIDFLAGKDLVTRYHVGPEVAKPYFWPVRGPGGVAMTRAWPMEKGQPGESTDHVHQKSVWFCHGDVIPEGVEFNRLIKGVEGVDFWSEAKGHGTIVCTKVGSPKRDKNHGWVITRNEWRTAEGTKILGESRTIHLYNFGDTKLLVLDIDLTAEVPVTFGDTKEGSFGIRINDAITEEKRVNKKLVKGEGKLENADGKVGERNKEGFVCWGVLSKWCDYSGPIGGRTVGLAILDDPTNPYPACWHSRGYGLMAANPFGRARSGFPAMKGKTELVKLEKGKSLHLRYGLLIHPGDAKEGKVAEYYDRFVKLKG
jgi:hypothetical protein